MCERVVLAISSALPSPDCWPNCESPVLLYRCTSILNRAAPPAYISNSVYVISPSHYRVSIRTSGSFHFSLPPHPHPQVSSCIVFSLSCVLLGWTNTVVCLCVSAVFLQCFYFEMPHWRCYSLTSILILLWIRLFFRQPMRLTYLSTLSLQLALKSQFAYFLMDIPNITLCVYVGGVDTKFLAFTSLTCWFVLYVSHHLRLSSLSADILILPLLL